MFREKNNDEIETVIGPSVQVEGNFVANGDIIIEGMVSGSIKTAKNLRVGQNAKIFANISAANAIIAGEIQGNVKIENNLELTSTSKIFGDIKTNVISIASGASINGKCLAGSDKKSKLEKIEDHEKHLKLKTKEEDLDAKPIVEKV